jgi:hypothetical protein
VSALVPVLALVVLSPAPGRVVLASVMASR